MSDVKLPDTAQFFETLCKLAHLASSKTADLYALMQETINVCLEDLPLTGAVIWLRSSEQDVLSPGKSRLPSGCSTSALFEDNELLQKAIAEGSCILISEEAVEFIQLPEDTALAIAPIESEDALLGLLGYVAANDILIPMQALLEANADILSAPLLTAWLRRQQEESTDVADTLFQFAGDLRTQPSLEAILSTLNNLSLRVFNCDLTAVYHWDHQAAAGTFAPVQIMTRIGLQDIEDEPSLHLSENPLLELVINDPDINSIHDLRLQPNALPVYLERHGLRGLVLVPILHESRPKGLLTLGYRAPLVPFSSRSTALALGLARMVGIALDRTQRKE
jgi:hypothetical protein